MFYFSNSGSFLQSQLRPTEFITALDNIDITEDNRIVFIEVRAEKSNKLYREVACAANIGKDTFFSTNEADYSDYVIQNFVEYKARKKTGGRAQNQGTGSCPCPPQGWQLAMRFKASHVPFRGPCFCSASMAYCEQVGV